MYALICMSLCVYREFMLGGREQHEHDAYPVGNTFYREHILLRTHSIENAFYRERILSRTHSIENTFY